MSSKKIVVTNISEKASEKTVKDFFLFCGKIKDFELIKEECSDSQIAYVTFERDTAAKTALMLTGAVIVDSQITVRPADEVCSISDETLDFSTLSQEDKPKAAIFAEILANGYTIQETIIEKGIEFDTRYGVSNILKQYLNQIQDNLKNLDKKYQVTDIVATRATDINDKYSVLNTTKYVIDQASCKVSDFFESSYGRYITGYLLSTKKSVADVQNLAKKLAKDKRDKKKEQKDQEEQAEQDFEPKSSHSHLDHSDYSEDQLVASE